MGFGHRKFLHIIPNKANPSPCEYTISSCFDYDVKHKKGYTIVAKPKSENTKKKFRNMCEYYEVPIYFFADKESLIMMSQYSCFKHFLTLK